MAKDVDEQSLKAIEEIVRTHPPGGMSVSDIAAALKKAAPPPRTLQYHLRQLVDQKRLIREGERRWARYHVPRTIEAVGLAAGTSHAQAVGEIRLPFSPEAEEIEAYVRKQLAARKPAGYDRSFLDAYRPNKSFYLTEKERAHLRSVGTPQIAPQPAGTYVQLHTGDPGAADP